MSVSVNFTFVDIRDLTLYRVFSTCWNQQASCTSCSYVFRRWWCHSVYRAKQSYSVLPVFAFLRRSFWCMV